MSYFRELPDLNYQSPLSTKTSSSGKEMKTNGVSPKLGHNCMMTDDQLVAEELIE